MVVVVVMFFPAARPLEIYCSLSTGGLHITANTAEESRWLYVCMCTSVHV